MKNIKFKTAAIALSLSAALALSVTACSSSDEKDGGSTEETTIAETTTAASEETSEATTTTAEPVASTSLAEINTKESAEDTESDSVEMVSPETASASDFNDQAVKDFAQKATDEGLGVIKIDGSLADNIEGYVEGFLATGSNISADSSSVIDEDSSIKVYQCYLFSDPESARKYYDGQVETFFSFDEDYMYVTEETDNGMKLMFDMNGIKIDMEVNGCLYTMIEVYN